VDDAPIVVVRKTSMRVIEPQASRHVKPPGGDSEVSRSDHTPGLGHSVVLVAVFGSGCVRERPHREFYRQFALTISIIHGDLGLQLR